MATILLQAAGGALGGLIGGPFGAMAGRAIGALGGSAIDGALFGARTKRQGPRLTASRIMEADEGAGVARLYGTARIAGQVIWTTRFEEVATTERTGGKGSARGRGEVTTYSYFGNVAIGLCEGPIAHVRRIWADGEELDLPLVTWRLHKGTEDQEPDPLIEARQGRGNAPAYRGLAYIVFERLPLERWGNRIPQMSCEVIRPVGELEAGLRAITIIPGATEHGLDPLAVRERVGPGEDRLINRNMLHGPSDLTASLDELTALCPRLERAALVVSWFADDLRVGHASVRPGVEVRQRDETVPWRGGGVTRDEARLVSQIDGAPAYGGTPSDAGVLRAIAELRGRGLKVTLYPFLMMDVPAGNGQSDPYGGAEQSPYPWRGRMTLDLAPGRKGSADRTAAARGDIARFLGQAKVSDFAVAGREVTYGGAPEWSYRRMILHAAHLAKLSGGVDAFVIGSEMRGLTSLRDEAGRFPFVDGLVTLAREVKALLPATLVTYAADWSEYFGYQPQDGSGDVFFQLDALWSDPAIGAIGIDNYLPLADWRDGDAAGEMPSPYDREALGQGVASGEYFDWFYPSEAARRAGQRSPISDGLGKPWVFRAKDLKSWWSNPHVERRGGVEQAQPTAWVPMSKPIWFTELGCPAIDKGANQPNVFYDPKSAESAWPHFSNGGRDDLAQRRFLEAHLRHWNPAAAGFEAANNPVSPIYGGRMVPPETIHVWCWDARPAPAFPDRADVWADGGNWERGHWLTGRLGRAPLDGLIDHLLHDHGFALGDTAEVDGDLGGFLVPGPGSARAELEELLRLAGVEARSEGGRLRFRSMARRGRDVLLEALADEGDAPPLEVRRAEPSEMAEEVLVGFSDPARAYQSGVAEAALGDADRPKQVDVELPIVLSEGQARRLAADLLDRETGERETASFALSPAALGLSPGDHVRLPGGEHVWRIERIEDGLLRRVEASRLRSLVPRPVEAGNVQAPASVQPAFASRPVVHWMDLPEIEGIGGAAVAAMSRPFVPLDLFASVTDTGFQSFARIGRPATLGALAQPLGAGREGVFDRTHAPVVELAFGALSSVPEAALMAGANRAAIRSASGAWEVIQFGESEEVAPARFRLRHLLRALNGTEAAMRAGHPKGAAFVLLDGACAPVPAAVSGLGMERHWLAAPSGRPLGDEAADRQTVALGRRALQPLSPCHLTGRIAADGTLSLQWVRRSRAAVEGWDEADMPLGEEREAYRVTLSAEGGSNLALDAGEPALRVEASVWRAVLPSGGTRLDIAVAQVSASVGPGEARRISFATLA
ncbi:baseplate multidomain protein megatron [Aureimonas sp. D3]|uniref:baseplate multidomain protein megatron n=1 Tax=Aureimonas sp. D3 TaxID=1638164 RepID=UPI00078213AE|nr:glycoside hydrolase/phage tail family protein [Aureimonas sp. D3]